MSRNLLWPYSCLGRFDQEILGIPEKWEMLHGHKERAIWRAELGCGVTQHGKAIAEGFLVQDGCSQGTWRTSVRKPVPYRYPPALCNPFLQTMTWSLGWGEQQRDAPETGIQQQHPPLEVHTCPAKASLRPKPHHVLGPAGKKLLLPWRQTSTCSIKVKPKPQRALLYRSYKLPTFC